MRTIKTKITLVTAFLFMLSCSGPYTYNDSGKKIEISEDDPFQIVLQGEANSNYSWQLNSKNEFTKLQEPIDIKTVGNNKTYSFNFIAEDDGMDNIVLIYTNGIDTKKSFKLKVIVGTMGEIYSK